MKQMSQRILDGLRDGAKSLVSFAAGLFFPVGLLVTLFFGPLVLMAVFAGGSTAGDTGEKSTVVADSQREADETLDFDEWRRAHPAPPVVAAQSGPPIDLLREIARDDVSDAELNRVLDAISDRVREDIEFEVGDDAYDDWRSEQGSYDYSGEYDDATDGETCVRAACW